jgi:plastocyanin
MVLGLAVHVLSARSAHGLVVDWRRIRMEPHRPSISEPPDDWAQLLKETRNRRRRPLRRWALVTLLLVATGAVMFQVGQAFAPTRPASAQPALPAVGPYGDPAATEPAPTTAPSAAYPAPKTTEPPATTAAARPRVLRLVTRNLQTEASPNRVYLAPGQVSAEQAARGRRPRFVVRAGEALTVRVANQDLYLHSFTFAKARVNLDIWEGTTDSATFDAPTTPGTYQFYCRYRKVGMSGTLVVRPVSP